MAFKADFGDSAPVCRCGAPGFWRGLTAGLSSLSPAICDMVRPVATERSFCSRMSRSDFLRAYLSSDLINSHGSCRSPGRLRMRTRCQRPLSFSLEFEIDMTLLH